MSAPTKGVRAAVLTAAETLGVQEFPVPRLGDEDALVRVEVVPDVNHRRGQT